MALKSGDVETYIDAMKGDRTHHYEVIKAMPLPYGMMDNLQELCKLALCELKRRETETALTMGEQTI